MKEPQTTYRLIHRVKDFKNWVCEWVIFNEDNELIESFGNDDVTAHNVWWSWLNDSERAEWNDYFETIEANAAEYEFQQRERRTLACDR